MAVGMVTVRTPSLARAQAAGAVPDTSNAGVSGSAVNEGAVELAPRPPDVPAENVEALTAADSAAVDALIGGSPSELPALGRDAPSVHVYGFADFNVTRPYLDEDNPIHKAADDSVFAIGNVNLYLASNLTHGFSSLIEVRLSYMPSGSFDPSGKVLTTYATDPVAYGRSERWGGIVLQRVHLDYSYSGLLNVRVGQFLTPYGIWNVDHGSPTLIPQFKPYPIGNAYFPERQMGGEVFGSYLLRTTTLGYHLTVSNGRGDVETSDFDKNKAVGGRLFVSNDAFGLLKVGVSAYVGRATQDVSLGISSSSGSGAIAGISQIPANQFDEFAVAGDVQWQWKNLHIQGEGILTQVRYTEQGRRLVTTLLGTPLGLVPDHVAWAWYGLIGYRLPWLSTMPFVLIDQFNQPAGAGPETRFNLGGGTTTGYNFGLNVRPVPTVVLKCQVSLVRVPHLDDSDLMLVGGQAAWAF